MHNYGERESIMKVYVNEITGIADAIVSMFMSKRSWTREMEMEIRQVCERVLTRQGRIDPMQRQRIWKNIMHGQTVL